MKATDYLDKWYEKLANAGEMENKILAEVISNFSKELLAMKEHRKAHINNATLSLFKEQNQKYNKFCRLVNEKIGVDYLYENGLKYYWTKNNPTLAALWK